MMLRQAITVLGHRTLFPVALVGSALVGLGALFMPHAQPGYYRLTLHAPEMENAIYVSAWNDGEVFANHDASDGKIVTYTRRADEHDGCKWEGKETLAPLGAHAYVYTYDEKILSCEADAHPFMRTPRRGIVTVEKVDAIEGVLALTALDDTQAPGDLWALEDSDGDELAVDVEEAVNAANDSLDDDDSHCGCDADDGDSGSDVE